MELNLNMGGATAPYDVIIIGGGPAGASAAIYTARANLRTLVLDKGLTAGALGITDLISNYPGVPGPISGAELVAIMRGQAESFGAEFTTDKVIGVDLSGETKTVHGGSGVYRGRAVILATGAMGRGQTVPGEEEFLGRGVSYCATCDGAFFRNRPVAVVGSNDEAVEEALFLTKFTDRVTLVSPAPTLTLQPALEHELTESPIQVRLGTRLRGVVGNGKLEGVRIHPREGNEETLPAEGVFIYLQGAKPITDYLMGQAATTDQGCLVVDAEMQTSLPGVFAVGDLLCTHVKQAVIAAADGVIAAMAVDKYLRGRSQLRVDWK
jgi:thioredoxin reductase (NADPH)